MPGKATQLVMQRPSDQRSLRLSWAPPRGEWERYRILLLNGSSVLVNRTEGKTVRQCVFPNLTPGRRYRAAVAVESGLLSSTAFTEGRLGT